MRDFFNLSTPAKRFRFIAVVEAITWAVLIVAMVVKRVADMDSAIRVPGMVHGIAFIVFVVITFLTARSLGWNWKVLLLALFSSLPPFCTVVFEWWAKRGGLLAELSTNVDDEPVGGEPVDHSVSV
ncbi:MAG: DUF3817 domain-containing protein [Gordonia sp. (in: high G+C Gram-positive bacteria)]